MRSSLRAGNNKQQWPAGRSGEEFLRPFEEWWFLSFRGNNLSALDGDDVAVVDDGLCGREGCSRDSGEAGQEGGLGGQSGREQSWLGEDGGRGGEDGLVHLGDDLGAVVDLEAALAGGGQGQVLDGGGYWEGCGHRQGGGDRGGGERRGCEDAGAGQLAQDLGAAGRQGRSDGQRGGEDSALLAEEQTVAEGLGDDRGLRDEAAVVDLEAALAGGGQGQGGVGDGGQGEGGLGDEAALPPVLVQRLEGLARVLGQVGGLGDGHVGGVEGHGALRGDVAAGGAEAELVGDVADGLQDAVGVDVAVGAGGRAVEGAELGLGRGAAAVAVAVLSGGRVLLLRVLGQRFDAGGDQVAGQSRGDQQRKESL